MILNERENEHSKELTKGKCYIFGHDVKNLSRDFSWIP